MSKIAVVVSSDAPAPVVMQIAKILSLAIGEVRTRVSTGEPVCEALLFMNDHEDVARRLRALIGIFQQAGVGFHVFELEDDEDFSTAPKEETEIDAGILENILTEWERRRDS